MLFAVEQHCRLLSIERQVSASDSVRLSVRCNVLVFLIFSLNRKKDVIVIEEEDEKPLIERLHEITTSCDISSPEKPGPIIKRDSNGKPTSQAAQNETKVSMTVEPVAAISKQSSDRQVVGIKRNANGTFVNRENNTGSSLPSSKVVSVSSETSTASSKPVEIQSQSIANSKQNVQTVPVSSIPISKITQARTKITPTSNINSPLLFESTMATSKPEIAVSIEKKSKTSSEGSGNSTVRTKSRPFAQTISSSSVVAPGSKKVLTESPQVVSSPASSVVSEKSDKSGTKETPSSADKDVGEKGEIMDEKYDLFMLLHFMYILFVHVCLSVIDVSAIIHQILGQVLFLDIFTPKV